MAEKKEEVPTSEEEEEDLLFDVELPLDAELMKLPAKTRAKIVYKSLAPNECICTEQSQGQCLYHGYDGGLCFSCGGDVEMGECDCDDEAIGYSECVEREDTFPLLTRVSDEPALSSLKKSLHGFTKTIISRLFCLSRQPPGLEKVTDGNV